MEDLATSVCAVQLAEACNVGLEPLLNPDVPALTPDRLARVKQNYLCAETLTRANARLVDAQSNIPLARTWGGGEVASADGLRFVVPVRTLNAGPNPKYFGRGKDVTYFNFVSDQSSGFHGIVIPGTLRDSLFLLDGLLEQQTSLEPKEVMTDTASYSDVIFGLFTLLGYQFSPRLADIGDARFWRTDKAADYGPLDGLARNTVNTSLITRNWDDLLRVAGSLKLGTVSASEFMRTLQATGRPSTLSRAIAELGRISKSLYLLAYLDDARYRRRILVQLNRGEKRHDLARVIFHGKRGEIRKRYREGQEDQLSAETSPISGGSPSLSILMANSSRSDGTGHQPGERRAPGGSLGYPHQPLSHPQKAQGRGTQEMVQMGFVQSNIPGASYLAGAYRP